MTICLGLKELEGLSSEEKRKRARIPLRE